MDEEFGKAAIFAVGLAVLIIAKADMLADRLESTEIRGNGSNRGLYFWGALILLGGAVAWVLFSRFGAGH